MVLYLTEVFHFVQHFVYFWNNILPIHKDWHIGAISQSNVKHSSVLKQGEKNQDEASSKLHPRGSDASSKKAVQPSRLKNPLTGTSRAVFSVCAHTAATSITLTTAPYT